MPQPYLKTNAIKRNPKLIALVVAATMPFSMAACEKQGQISGNEVAISGVETFSSDKLETYSITDLQAFADQGVTEAKLRRCERALVGGLKTTPAQTSQWCLTAAKEGLGFSYMPVATAYAEGVGLDKDLIEAVTWYERAAELGNSSALAALSDAYLSGGEGVTNYELSKEYAEKALTVGEASGALNIAKMAYNGLAGERSVVNCAAYANLGLRLYDQSTAYTEGVYDETRAAYVFLQDICEKEASNTQRDAAARLLNKLQSQYMGR